MTYLHLKRRGRGEAIVTFVRDDDSSTSGQLATLVARWRELAPGGAIELLVDLG